MTATTVKDPVCGMELDERHRLELFEYRGRSYYFAQLGVGLNSKGTRKIMPKVLRWTKEEGRMCRFLCYIGPEVLLADLLYRPKNSLILQSYKPKERRNLSTGTALALAGNGAARHPAFSQASLRPGTIKT